MCQRALAAERDTVMVFLSVCLSVQCWCVSERLYIVSLFQLSGSDSVLFLNPIKQNSELNCMSITCIVLLSLAVVQLFYA